MPKNKFIIDHTWETNGRFLNFSLNDMLVGEYLFQEVITKSEYLPKEIKLDESTTGSILDIGANVGLFSCLVAAIAPNANVFAFEPSKKNYERLKFHVEINKLQNLRIFNYGLGSISSEQKLYTPHDEGAYSLIEENAARYTRGNGYEGKYEIVKIQKLSEFIKKEKLTSIDFLKMDCEGSEESIMTDLIPHLNSINQIAIEWHPNVKKEFLSNILVNSGFDVWVERERFKNNDPVLSMGNLFGRR